MCVSSPLSYLAVLVKIAVRKIVNVRLWFVGQQFVPLSGNEILF